MSICTIFWTAILQEFYAWRENSREWNLGPSRLYNFTAQDLKKHDLLRVAAATDAAEIVAELITSCVTARPVCRRQRKQCHR
jgi:hypothetical protein